MTTYTSLLTTLGLSENEARIYESLLKKSHQSASEVASHTKLKRTTVYGSIESLIRGKYISARKQAKKTVYVAHNPSLFLQHVEEERHELTKKEKALEMNMPVLAKLYESDTQYPQIHMSEGIQSFLEMRESMFEALKKHKNGYSIGSASMLYKLIGEETYTRKFTQRHRQLVGTKMYHIVDKNDFDIKRARQGEGDFHEFRFLPQTYSPEAHMIMIGSQLYILKVTDPVSCIVIDSPEIVSACMFMWRAVWTSCA